ncbi:hypothetical protein LK994_08855 [Ferruginibacter lapsinanis]|uniref:hypothetical protein n=1 Tax=Ferruginibacter lapsinanis TaxID=563172 RepID=UPI001E4BB2F3|nr:hypothetical protein [Ferruginibacter lapsinanis]UEG48745.1 hypothetical protein LK994_08855 [Ferruginibacter lapsinanis]
MIKGIIPFLFCVLSFISSSAQDSSIYVGKKVITLSEVVVDNKLNVPTFINRIKSDSSFYKAFRNLHIIQFSSNNDIRMLDKHGEIKASLVSKTKQIRENNCRKMEVLEEQSSGDFYTDDHQYNYYTANMYASLFFTNGLVCGEDNIVAGREFSTSGKTGMDKHKEQLKMLFFNPGKRINGLPFMSNKTAIYDDDIAENYDMSIDMDEYNKTSCYIFKQKVKPGKEGSVVLDEMTTWFDDKTFDVVARNYTLSYDAGVYDFKVQMEVQMTHFGDLLVPSLLRYNGNWKAIFKKRERGVFTATLFDFQ